MTIFLHVPCHMMQLILSVFYMYAVTNLNVIILLSNIFLQMIEFMVQQSVYYDSCKLHGLAHKIVVRCGKLNGEHYMS
jgi:hypothetical protein